MSLMLITAIRSLMKVDISSRQAGTYAGVLCDNGRDTLSIEFKERSRQINNPPYTTISLKYPAKILVRRSIKGAC